MKNLGLFFLCFLLSCEKNPFSYRKVQKEAICRLSDQKNYEFSDPVLVPRGPYPWEDGKELPKLSIEAFRCKGSCQHSEDCEGPLFHGLPLFNGKEGVYPVLLDLLNHVQKKLQKKVIVTSGHRCPLHQLYSSHEKVSKHMIGAEVDFYVQGLEDDPLKVVNALASYYQGHNKSRFEHQGNRFTNREIEVVIISEGEDLDNNHYPYLSIRVLYDRDKKEKVSFSWDKARQYLRW